MHILKGRCSPGETSFRSIEVAAKFLAGYGVAHGRDFQWCGYLRLSGEELWTRQRITVWQCELEEEEVYKAEREQEFGS